MTYVALEEVKASLELSGLSYADEDLRLAIDAATQGVDEYCGRTFTAGTVGETRYYSPATVGYAYIDDVITVGTVVTDWDGDGTYETTWSATEYVLEPLNASSRGKPYEAIRAQPRADKGFPCGWPASLKVTGTFGWTAVPAPVKEATGIMAERLLKRRRDAPFGIVGLGFENAAVRIPTVDPDLRFLLDPFVKGGGVLAA